MMKVLLLTILLFSLVVAEPAADSMAGAGAGCQYLFDDAILYPEIWIKAAADVYAKLSEDLTLFGEGRLFSVYNQMTREIYSGLDLAADLSFMPTGWLLRWGIKSDVAYTTGYTSAVFIAGTDLLFSFGSDSLTVKLLPGIIYYSTDRILLNFPLKTGLAMTLFEQLIFTPEMTGGLDFIRAGSVEPFYAIESKMDWYPGAPFTLSGLIGFKEKFSENSYPITENLTIPEYFGYRDTYSHFSLTFLLGDKISINLSSLISYKQMKHPAVLLPQLGDEPEWQFKLKPELKLDIAFTELFSMLLSANLLKIYSNTSYEAMTYAGVNLEMIYNF